MQRLVFIACFLFLSRGLMGQTTGMDSVRTTGYRPELYPLVILEQDTCNTKCNWNTTQTFAYLDEKYYPDFRHKIVLTAGPQKFCMPVQGQLWSPFKKGHNGLDIILHVGDSVRAAFDGVVRYAQYNKGGFGNLVIVRHPSGLETYYAHFSKLLVTPGQKVMAGQVVGLGGTTGRSRGPHLHFEVRFRDRPIDPISFIDYEKRQLKCTELELNRFVYEPWNCRKNDTVLTETNTSLTTTKPPVNSPVANSAVYHVVKKGDTLYSIALRNKTTVNAICQLNRMKETDILSIGKKLRIR